MSASAWALTLFGQSLGYGGRGGETAALLCARADTFDAYVATTGSVKLVDFNPVGGTTSPLLFEWHELGLEHAAQGGDAGHAREEEEEEQGAGRGAPLVRVVPAASYVQAGHRAVCAMPFDMLGLTNTVESMVGRMQQQRQQ